MAVAGLGGLILVAHFAVFTFVAELLAPSGVPTPALLLVFGAVGAIGVAIVGMVSDRYPGIVPVVVGMRCWKPFIAEAIACSLMP